MTNIILSGCNGKMGRVITRIVSELNDVKIVCGFDINTEQNGDYPVYDDLNKFEGKADAIIDFSHPASLSAILEYACATNTPAVIATTGLTAQQKEEMNTASEKTAVFFSANYSIGINLLIELAKRATAVLDGAFDIEIVEKHHNQKIDAPSGTALAIADEISTVLKTAPEYVYDRHSVRKKRDKREIGMHAVRGGTIVGEHTVIFAGHDETIELNHQAASKEVFAEGAVRAAKFMHGKTKGMYNMKNLVESIDSK